MFVLKTLFGKYAELLVKYSLELRKGDRIFAVDVSGGAASGGLSAGWAKWNGMQGYIGELYGKGFNSKAARQFRAKSV